MRLSVVALLSNLNLPDDFRRTKINGINLEKQGLQIKQFNDQIMIDHIGIIQHHQFSINPCFYVNTEIDPTNNKYQDLDKMLMLRGFVQNALFSLWLIKDNAVNSHLIISRPDNLQISLNRSPHIFSNSKGEYGQTFFSKDELQVAKTWFPLVLEAFQKGTEPTIKKEGETEVFTYINSNKNIPYDKSNRLQRTINFVNIARSDSFLSAKITFYISALEALLSDADAELKYQVADRSARILGENQEEKLKISKIIGDAYNFRSKYIHGTAGKKSNVSEDLLIDVDDILRRLIKLFLTDLNHVVEMKPDEFRVWLKELAFN